MATAGVVSAEEALVAELELLGIRYLSRQTSYQAAQVRPPDRLLADLARQPAARVRQAIIAVLLAHPGYADSVPEALARLDAPEALTLRLFYTAAVLLQKRYAERLRPEVGDEWRWLLDRFSAEFGIPAGDTPLIRKLELLARAHGTRAGVTANWAGTYDNVARKLIRRWEMERQWGQKK
jgi:hypothetical protein